MRRVMLFLVLLLTALTVGLEFAHVLEWPRKQHYPGALYVRLQESLYVWFGNLGGIVYVLAVLATVVLAVLVRRDRGWRWPVAVAAGLQVLALVSFLAVIYPVNQQFPVGGTGAVPSDWAALRERWELGHSLGFVLFAASFVLTALTLVRSFPDPHRHGSSTAPIEPDAVPRGRPAP